VVGRDGWGHPGLKISHGPKPGCNREELYVFGEQYAGSVRMEPPRSVTEFTRGDWSWDQFGFGEGDGEFREAAGHVVGGRDHDEACEIVSVSPGAGFHSVAHGILSRISDVDAAVEQRWLEAGQFHQVVAAGYCVDARYQHAARAALLKQAAAFWNAKIAAGEDNDAIGIAYWRYLIAHDVCGKQGKPEDEGRNEQTGNGHANADGEVGLQLPPSLFVWADRSNILGRGHGFEH